MKTESKSNNWKTLVHKEKIIFLNEEKVSLCLQKNNPNSESAEAKKTQKRNFMATHIIFQAE